MVFGGGVSDGCAVAGCDEPVVGRGLCRSHYDRARESGRPVKPVRSRVCLVCGRAFQLERLSKKFCSRACAQKFRRVRERNPFLRISDEPNPVIVSEPVTAVPVADTGTDVAEDFTEADVWERSGGLCHVCGLEASRDVDAGNAGTPSWIVQPKDGGSRALANRAVFHYRCLGKPVRSGRGRKRKEGRET